MDTVVLHNLLFCMVICGAKIVEISMSSLKTVLLVKGMRTHATVLAFIECMIWGLIVSRVITGLASNFAWLFAYCIGYSTGYYIGSVIENKMAMGTITLSVIIPKDKTGSVEEYLKNSNHGYFIYDGHGATGEKTKVETVIPRKGAKDVRKHIAELCDNEIFVTNSDVSFVRGGYGVKRSK